MKSKNHGFKRSSHLGVLPLTSMIDVVFLLLVYFLVTSNFAQMERDLPSSLQAEGTGARSSELLPQIVDIEAVDGAVVYRIGARVVRSKGSLVGLLSSLPKEPGIAIRAKGDVPIGAIATAMQASKDAGFLRRSYVPRD